MARLGRGGIGAPALCDQNRDAAFWAREAEAGDYALRVHVLMR